MSSAGLAGSDGSRADGIRGDCDLEIPAAGG